MVFWGEALSKTQISGANTRLALIILKGVTETGFSSVGWPEPAFREIASTADSPRFQHCTGAPRPNGPQGCTANY